MLQHGITAIIVSPAHTGQYTGPTHATKFRYKAELGLYNEYKEHMYNSIRALTSCFTEGLLIDLETNGEVIRYTPIEIYDHIKSKFFLPRDISRETTKTRSNLRVAYDPDEIVRISWKSNRASVTGSSHESRTSAQAAV